MTWLEAFRPDAIAEHVTEVTPAWLAGGGFVAVLLDLDNTLVEWRSTDVPAEIAAWIDTLRAAGVRMTILSNTHRPSRLRALAAELGVGHVAGVGKPARGGYQRGLAQLNCPPGRAVVVGDQLLTDILGGNRCGLFTVWVRPLSRREFIGTRLISRRIEAAIAGALDRRGWLQPITTTPNG